MLLFYSVFDSIIDMNKIRFLFVVVVFLILLSSVFLFNTVKFRLEPDPGKISEFKITRISGPGTLYLDENPIAGGDFSNANPVGINSLDEDRQMYLMTDAQVSFEFYCWGTSFTVLPNSHLFYRPDPEELRVFPGEYAWKREVKSDRKITVLLAKKNEPGIDTALGSLTLSGAGQMNYSADLLVISNYSGSLAFQYGEQVYGLAPNQALVLGKDKKVQVVDILLAPEFIAPEDKFVVIEKPEDSILDFNWKPVLGAREYLLRLYTSSLKENILDEWLVADNTRRINLQVYELTEFFWQVTPYDSVNKKEGTPSRLGHVRLSGLLKGKEDALKPPHLVVTSLTVSGNVVLIKGEADKNSLLFINGDSCSIGIDGTFFATLNFRELGQKTIQLRLVAPTGVENNITRQVDIYDE